MTAAPTPDEVRTRLAKVRAARGYLLPHQGVLAAAMPDLQDAYFVMYRALTLTDRHLTPFEREFVWLAILVATHEAVGTHHVDLFFRHGGTAAQAETVLRLVAYARGGDAFAFVDEHWRRQFPACAGPRAYHAGLDALLSGSDLPRGLADIALAAVQAARSFEWGLAAHIESAYANRIPEGKLAEALSLIMWPTGVNRFLEACQVWLHLARAKRVQPSPAFQAWVDTPGQGGFGDSG